MYLVLLIIFVVSMLGCHLLAKKKGRHPVAWGLSGALLGPFALLIILLMPDNR